MKDIQQYLDQNGFVITKEQNDSRAGNSAQHTAMFILLRFSLGIIDFEKAKDETIVMFHMIMKDEPRLYWLEYIWPGQKGHMSRDNLVAFVCILKIFKCDDELKELMQKVFKRFGFLWNTRTIGSEGENKHKLVPDWCGPMILFVYFLGRWKWLDSKAEKYLLLTGVIQTANTKRDKTETDGHLNIFNLMETFRIIRNSEFVNGILMWYKGEGIVQYALKDYFNGDLYAPLDDLAIEVIEKNWPTAPQQ